MGPDGCQCNKQCVCGKGKGYDVFASPLGPPDNPSTPWDEAVYYEQADHHYVQAYKALLEMHIEKSKRYGSKSDRLNNLVQVALLSKQDKTVYPIQRIIEKCVRVLEIVTNGDEEEKVAMDELMDIAGLALCAEALRLRQDDTW